MNINQILDSIRNDYFLSKDQKLTNVHISRSGAIIGYANSIPSEFMYFTYEKGKYVSNFLLDRLKFHFIIWMEAQNWYMPHFRISLTDQYHRIEYKIIL